MASTVLFMMDADAWSNVDDLLDYLARTYSIYGVTQIDFTKDLSIGYFFKTNKISDYKLVFILRKDTITIMQPKFIETNYKSLDYIMKKNNILCN